MGLDARIYALRVSVLKFVFVHLDVAPWLVLSGSRKAWVCEARAAAATLLRLEGLSYRQVAEALMMKSQSSAYELIDTYRLHGQVLQAVSRWQRDKRLLAEREAFGNSTSQESDHFVDANKMVGEAGGA